MIVIDKEKTSFIPRELIESLAFLHPGIDPETGHYVCHHIDMGISLIKVGNEEIPSFMVGDCILIVVGDRSINKLLEHMSEVKDEVTFESDTISIEGALASSELSRVFTLLWEYRAKIRFYKIEIEGSHRLAVLVEVKDSWKALIVSGNCLAGEHVRGEEASLHV